MRSIKDLKPLLMKFINWEFSRFIVIGFVNSVLTYVIYLFFHLFMEYRIAYSVSYITGIFTSYYLNSRYVFMYKFNFIKALQYPVVYMVQYVIGVSSLYVFVEMFNISEIVAPILTVLITMPVTFYLSRTIIKGRAIIKVK